VRLAELDRDEGIPGLHQLMPPSGFASRSLDELEPWNPGVFVARAVVLGAIGRCDEAVDAVQRALDVLPDDPPPSDVRALVRERERIRVSGRPADGP
jgi:hypothetical protein